MLKKVHLLFLLAFSIAPLIASEESREDPFRPPAVPLIAHDPYFSIWSPHDRLTDGPTEHWTGKRQSLESMVLVDGKAFRLMGGEPAAVPALPQTKVEVLPTRTIYEWKGPEVQVVLTFLAPALPEVLEVLSRPLTYLIWEVRSVDGKPRRSSIYFGASAELCVDTPAQSVVWSREEIGGLIALKAGSKDQRILARKGDDLRIDWGYLYAAAPRGESLQCAIAGAAEVRESFAAGRPLPSGDDPRVPRPASDGWPTLAFAFDLGEVGAEPVSRHLLLAYDDLFSIKLFGQNLRPYWRRAGAGAADLLREAERDLEKLHRRSREFDEAFLADLTEAGGRKYARLAALAYRTTLAGSKLAADSSGQPLFFPKENFSNGCISTVDVIYPMAPLFLLLGSTLSKATVVPILEYARSPRWKHPFAPHDLGTYPHATGQVYGGGEATEENQMPVEESANLLLILEAIAAIDGDADFAAKYWPVLARWAGYLREKGMDPENQLCTDDFTGHLAHNVNLSAKAILALGAYAKLCGRLGKLQEAAAYRKTAEGFVRRWIETAADGDHTRLAFDRPGTWSQKYNLVWDRILDLRLFPEDVSRKEVAYYRKIQNRYGVPLDNRAAFTKLDWTIWSATLTGSREDFEALVSPVYDFLNESPSRVPMTDWYDTKTGKAVGFRGRPVLGAVFVKLLERPEVWKKWAGKGPKAAGAWADLPRPPETSTLVPDARKEPVRWHYTFEKPAEGWFQPEFKASAWKEGPAGFGTEGTPGARVRTEWKTAEIWLRREFTLPERKTGEPQLLLHHDEDAEVYLNGFLAAREAGYTTSYELVPIAAEAASALRSGRNVLAVHCRQTGGGQYIDVGIVLVR